GERAVHVHRIDRAIIIVDPLGIARGIGWRFGRQVFAAFFVDGSPYRGERGGDRAEIGTLHRGEVRLLGVAALGNPVLFQAESEGQRQISLVVLTDDVFDLAELRAAG